MKRNTKKRISAKLIILTVFILLTSFTQIWANTTSEELSTDSYISNIEKNDENDVIIEEVDEEDKNFIEIEKNEINVVDEEEVSQVDMFSVIDSIAALQTAFDNAIDGETIYLTDAIATEVYNNPSIGIVLSMLNVDTRNITIDGNGITLDGNNLHNKVLFDITNNGSGTITLRNMTVTKTKNTAFDVKGTGNVTIENVVITDITASGVRNVLSGVMTITSSKFINTYGFGDATNALGHTINVEDSYFYGNGGSAFTVNSNAIAVISKSTFENNSHNPGYNGGAIATSPESTNIKLTIKSSYFYMNRSVNGTGGAIGIYHLSNSDVVIEDSVFEKNHATGLTSNVADGGAISIKNNSTNYSNATVTIRNNYFYANIADDNAGAILIEASNGGTTSAVVYNNTFFENIANNLGSTSGGGAIQTYETPDTVISHNTFYKNDSLNNTNGGAIMMHGNWRNSGVISPVIANNIFVDNNLYRGANNSANVGKLFSITTNVSNNGNVGYDLGQKFIPDDQTRNDLVKVENIFTEFDNNGIAVPIIVPGTVGSDGHTSIRKAYIPSPRIDEMLRTNDPRTITGILTDVRGYPREALTASNPYYPNAGAVEIYWTKFDVGAGAWTSRFNVELEGGLESLAYPGIFYKINNPPTFENGEASYEENFTFTRNTLQGPTDYGFTGWYDADKDETKDVNSLYFARKQTYVAQWEQNTFHLDFDFNGGSAIVGNESHFDTQIVIKDVGSQLGTLPLSNPVNNGLVFDGWYTDDVLFSQEWNFDTDIVDQDITLYAKWSVSVEYILDFDMQGHGEQIPSQTIVNEDICSKPVDPQEDGYTFIGWYTDTTFTEKFDFDAQVTHDLTAYANWQKIDEVPGTATFSTSNNTIMMITGIGLLAIVLIIKKRYEVR